MNIREKLFQYRLQKQPNRDIQWSSYEKAKKVFILYPSDWIEKNESIHKMVSELQDERKEVTLWGYIPSKKEISRMVLPQSRILGKRNFGIFGRPKDDVLSDLLSEEYDVLIDLTQQPTIEGRYLAMYVKASFKAGLFIPENMGENDQDGIHDFMISTEPQDNPYYLYSQIKKYLQILHQ